MSTIKCISTAFIFLLTISMVSAQTADQVKEFAKLNGFDLKNLLVPTEELRPGGPPRDGIPSVDNPRFARADKAGTFIYDTEYVLGIEVDGETKAYPVRVLSWHEVVNDNLGGRSLAITYSPLCASGIAYATDIDGQPRSFGVSGLLHDNNSVLYDRETESLWSQVTGQAIAGADVGGQLDMLPATYTTWEEWKRLHPETMVMTENTGFERNYKKTPYQWYESCDELLFPVARTSKLLDLKEKIIGVEVAGEYRAYPYSLLPSGRTPELTDRLNGQLVHITYNEEAQAATVKDENGDVLPSATMYWFAWYSFHPNTDVYGMDRTEPMVTVAQGK